MSDTIVRVLVRLGALALGLLWGFFVAFNVVFSDVFGTSAMVGAVGFVLVAYLLLGLVFGVVAHKSGFRLAGWLAAPGTLFVLLMIGDNPARIVYTLGVASAVILGTVAGIWLGESARRLAGGRRHRHEGTGGATPTA